MILGRNLLPTDGWFPKITWSGADGRECGLWTPHLLWTWEAHGSWRGRKHNSVHKAWGATAIRCAWKIVPFHKAPSTAGESVAIEINQDMQILCFCVTVWMMDVHYTQAHKHFIWEGQHNVFSWLEYPLPCSHFGRRWLTPVLPSSSSTLQNHSSCLKQKSCTCMYEVSWL